MSDTPRTDKSAFDIMYDSQKYCPDGIYCSAEVSRDLERELANMEDRVRQLSEENIRITADFFKWMEGNNAVDAIRKELHATDQKLVAMTASKNKAVEGLRFFSIHCRCCINMAAFPRKVIAELEEVKT